MANLQLVLGAGHIDRTIYHVDELLQSYQSNWGYQYMKYHSPMSKNTLFPEDLAVTSLVNSRFTARAFLSIQLYAHTIRLESLPDKSLEETTDDERSDIAILITNIAQWSGFAASLATKVLHKKRPQLIPILDNQAIFGAYMYKSWPQSPSASGSIKDKKKIHTALNWIQFDLTRAENADIWPILEEIHPDLTRLQIFDGVWWEYFRSIEPVK